MTQQDERTDDDDDDEALLSETADRVFDGLSEDDPLTGLSPARQVFVRVYTAQGILDNGGLPYFFGSDFPGTPDYSSFSNAYREIGAIEVASWMEEVVALFPDSAPHKDAAMRNRCLAPHATDSCAAREAGACRMCDLGDCIVSDSDRVFSLLAEFVRAHPLEFRGA